MNAMEKLLIFLGKLEKMKIFYRLSHPREETIMVEIAVPGERWEVEYFSDGAVEVEVFTSLHGVEEEEALSRLFAKHSE
jgi:hypothetical protein